MSEQREPCPQCGAGRWQSSYEYTRWHCGTTLWRESGRAEEGKECLCRQIARLQREREVLAAAIRARHEFETRRDWSVPNEAWPGAAYYGAMAASDEAWRRALRLLEEGVLEDEAEARQQADTFDHLFTDCCKTNKRYDEVNARLRKLVRTIHLGRMWCDACQAWDYECGCTPSVTERYRANLIREAWRDEPGATAAGD